MRLIDGDALLNQLEGILSDYTSRGLYPNGFTIESAIDEVVDMPTITTTIREQAQVSGTKPKTGEWFEDGHGYDRCSECGWRWDEPETATMYCPSCGARMEKRLPDAEEEVRLFCITPSGYKYQCQGFYVPPGMHRDDSGYSWDGELCDQYDEDLDDYFVKPGWYETIHNWDEYSAFRIVDKVTHWTPLPEPPETVNV